MLLKQMFMSKNDDHILNCFILLQCLFSFHYVIISLIICCVDEVRKAESLIQLIKSYYVTVVFLAQ